MEVHVGQRGEVLGFGLWQVWIVIEKRYRIFRLPFLGEVSWHKEEVGEPWKFSRMAWAECRQVSNKRLRRLTACWLALLVGNMEAARKITDNEEEAEEWCLYYERIGTDLLG